MTVDETERHATARMTTMLVAAGATLVGVTICLPAGAELLEPIRPRWIAVAGSAVGAWIAGAAPTVALGGTVIPDWLAFVSAIVGGDIWLIAWAASLRRRVNGMAAGPYADDRRAA